MHDCQSTNSPSGANVLTTALTKERVHIEDYSSKNNDCRTCKISKGLFLTESEINGSSERTKENFTPVEIYIFSERIDHEQCG